MQLSVAYRHRSTIRQSTTGLAVSLAPNLRRDRVSFVGTLRQPLRFREAVSALHDVDRKSTRLNSSHVKISYAVFCLKKKNVTPLDIVHSQPDDTSATLV